jgi:hypothetical protein
MTHDEFIHLLSERAALQRFIDETPEEDVLDRGSMIARVEELDELIAAGETDQREPARVRLTFRGRPVVGSQGIFAEFASKALNDFTESVVAMAASLTTPLGARGVIPKRGQHQLLITSTALGSFGFELQEHQPEKPLFDDTTPLAEALARTQKLLHGTLGSDEELADSAMEVDDRALDKVRIFLETLVESEATCVMAVGTETVVFADIGQVRTGVSRQSRENIREEQQVIEGQLQGVLPKGRVFEFKLEADGQVIRGKVGPDIPDADALNDYLHKPVSIKVTATRVGNGRRRYVLRELPKPKP